MIFRKSIRRAKDDFKISKEILKIRNSFHTINIRNKLLLKRYGRYEILKPLVQNCDTDLLLRDLKVFQDDTEKVMDDDIDTLILNNDNQFKINQRHILRKTIKEYRKSKIGIHPQNEKINRTELFDENKKQYIRVDCRLSKTLKRIENGIQDLTIQHIDNNEEKSNNFSTLNSQANDLKTVLIMMASSKPIDSDESTSSSRANIITTAQQERTNLPVCDLVMPSHDASIADVLSVMPLKTVTNKRETDIAHKFVNKWKAYVINKKNKLENQRQETLNHFFDKLVRKKKVTRNAVDCANKAKLLANDYNTYQHRYKIQKHIIAIQKAKLEEQTRLIEQLKYNKIIEASRQSVDAMKDEVRKTYYDIDRQLKPKIKCLTNELNLHEIEEPSLVLHCLKVPRFLQRMEKRARERDEKHAIIRERRRQMEEERIRVKQQAELAKAEMDKEEKIKRIKELRDKRKREKVENIRRKQYAARLRGLIVMADLHYEKSLMSKYGLKPFKILLDIKRDNFEKAKIHYTFQLKKNIFLNWMWYTEDMWFERNYIADEFNRKKLLRKYFNSFIENARDYTLKKQVAEDYYDLYVTQLVFRKFREAISIVRKENETKLQKAEIYYNRLVIPIHERHRFK
ncbi:hypothetical protein ACJJTC_006719 [Scirpophaga incertulas]